MNQAAVNSLPHLPKAVSTLKRTVELSTKCVVRYIATHVICNGFSEFAIESEQIKWQMFACACDGAVRNSSLRHFAGVL
jgi:hypothetical protein